MVGLPPKLSTARSVFCSRRWYSKLARVFEQIDLYMAVSSEAHPHAVFEKTVNGNNAIAKIPLGRGQAQTIAPRVGKHANRFRRNVNHVNTGEPLA